MFEETTKSDGAGSALGAGSPNSVEVAILEVVDRRFCRLMPTEGDDQLVAL